MISILFLGANPDNTTRLALTREIRTIDERLRGSEHGSLFKIEQGWAVRPDDLQNLLLRHRPTVVHFSGHGHANGELAFEDDQGNATQIDQGVLSELFRIFGKTIRCVVLNACYSESQAREIAKHVDLVIGMSDKIKDTSATAFAAGFYEALGFGKDAQTAFELACNRIGLRNLPGANIPQILCRKGVTARELTLVNPT